MAENEKKIKQKGIREKIICDHKFAVPSKCCVSVANILMLINQSISFRHTHTHTLSYISFLEALKSFALEFLDNCT